MTTETNPAGAMPVVESATLFQSYPFGPGWAAYRLPFPRLNAVLNPRELGISFEGEPGGAGDPPPAGAKPPAGDGSGGTTDGDADPPATGDAKLGEAGKKALDAERAARKASDDRAKAAEKALEDLKLAHGTDEEKKLAAAKSEGKTEVIERLHASVRRTAVREALLTAGAIPSLVADLSRADEFSGLKVSDEDEIDEKELGAAVKAHKDRVPDAYKAPGDSGSADGGPQARGKPKIDNFEDAISAHYEGKA